MNEYNVNEEQVNEMTRLQNLYMDLNKIIMNPQTTFAERDEAKTQRLSIYIKMQKLASSTNQANIFQNVPIPNTDLERQKVEQGLAAAEAQSQRIRDLQQAINDNENAMTQVPVHSLQWENMQARSLSLRVKLNRETSGASTWTGKP